MVWKRVGRGWEGMGRDERTSCYDDCQDGAEEEGAEDLSSYFRVRDSGETGSIALLAYHHSSSSFSLSSSLDLWTLWFPTRRS